MDSGRYRVEGGHCTGLGMALRMTLRIGIDIRLELNADVLEFKAGGCTGC